MSGAEMFELFEVEKESRRKKLRRDEAERRGKKRRGENRRGKNDGQSVDLVAYARDWNQKHSKAY